MSMGNDVDEVEVGKNNQNFYRISLDSVKRQIKKLSHGEQVEIIHHLLNSLPYEEIKNLLRNYRGIK